MLNYFTEVIIEKPAHVLCRLCMPQHSGYYNLEEEADVNAEDLCHSCNHRLARGSTIANSSEQVRCYSSFLFACLTFRRTSKVGLLVNIVEAERRRLIPL